MATLKIPEPFPLNPETAVLGFGVLGFGFSGLGLRVLGLGRGACIGFWRRWGFGLGLYTARCNETGTEHVRTSTTCGEAILHKSSIRGRSSSFAVCLSLAEGYTSYSKSPKPQTPNPKPQTPNPKPQTPNPKPQTPNPKPQTPNPKPQTPNPKPQTPNPKP